MASTRDRGEPAGRNADAEPGHIALSENERRERISMAAYYNAERRGFEEGSEVDDWLQAERELSPPPGPADGGHAGNGENVEPDQVKQWAAKLEVSAAKLREAIRSAGPRLRDVKDFLSK